MSPREIDPFAEVPLATQRVGSFEISAVRMRDVWCSLVKVRDTADEARCVSMLYDEAGILGTYVDRFYEDHATQASVEGGEAWAYLVELDGQRSLTLSTSHDSIDVPYELGRDVAEAMCQLAWLAYKSHWKAIHESASLADAIEQAETRAGVSPSRS